MKPVEDELTELLHRRAATLPPDPQLLTAVKARSHRRALRHRALAVTAAAAVAAVGVVLPSVLPHLADPAIGRQLGTGQAGRPGFLAAAPSVTPYFPLSPTYLPPGVQRNPRLSHEPGIFNADYDAVKPGRDGPLSGVSVQVFPGRQPIDQGAKPRPVTVLSHPAKLVAQPDVRRATVTWLNKPAQWVTVSGWNEWSTQQIVLRVANGLRDRTLTGRPSFTFKLAPASYRLAGFNAGGVSLARHGDAPAPHGPDDPTLLTVNVLKASGTPDGRPVRVGDRSGWLVTASGSRALVLKLSAKDRLEILAPAALWTEVDLRTFAAGISYIGPPPGSGG